VFLLFFLLHLPLACYQLLHALHVVLQMRSKARRCQQTQSQQLSHPQQQQQQQLAALTRTLCPIR
jgi:hypothetical protein